jgi:hypothetical protein
MDNLTRYVLHTIEASKTAGGHETEAKKEEAQVFLSCTSTFQPKKKM